MISNLYLIDILERLLSVKLKKILKYIIVTFSVLTFIFIISEFLFNNNFDRAIINLSNAPPNSIVPDNVTDNIVPIDTVTETIPDDIIIQEQVDPDTSSQQTNPPPIEEPTNQQEESTDPTQPDEQENTLSTFPLPNEHLLTEFINKLIEIAEGQPKNPQNEEGRTKYGELFDNPYTQWCTEFVMWCIKETETQLGTDYIGTYFPWKDSAYRCVVWYKKNNSFMLKRNYIPRRGDLIFFDYDFDENCDHTGLVTGIEYDKEEDKLYVLTIEGNLPEDYPNGVIRTRRLSVDEVKIYGYGTFMLES